MRGYLRFDTLKKWLDEIKCTKNNNILGNIVIVALNPDEKDSTVVSIRKGEALAKSFGVPFLSTLPSSNSSSLVIKKHSDLTLKRKNKRKRIAVNDLIKSTIDGLEIHKENVTIQHL